MAHGTLPPVGGHRADVQGLRGVAVLLVVAFHAGLPLSGGFIGVDVFFVISGYVIAAMLLRQLEAGEFTFRGFYTRRARRLLPALGVLLAFVGVASMLLLSPYGPQQATADTGIAAVLFHANLQLNGVPGGYFALSAETNALLHTWSLSVEEQFYFVFPAVVVGVWRLTARRWQARAVSAVIGAASGASFAFSWWMTSNRTFARGWDFAFYSPFSRAWEFGVGALVAILAVKAPRGAAWAGVAAVGGAAVLFDGMTSFPGPWALVPVLGTATILAAARGVVTGALEDRRLVRLGDLSYGWYLWHWPLIVFAVAMWPGNELAPVSAGLLSLAPAWLSYRFVERPARFHPQLVGRRVAMLVAGCLIVPISGFQALTVATGALSDVAGGATVPANPAGRGGRVVLVGDSNAWHFAPPVRGAAAAKGFTFDDQSSGGCPFADVIRDSKPTEGFNGESCHAAVTAAVASMEAERPALVVVAMAGPQYLRAESLALTDPTTGERATTPDRKAVVWASGIARTLGRLDAAGVPVLFVSTVPHLGDVAGDWSMRTCPAVRFLTESCAVTVTRAEVEARQRRALDAERPAVDLPMVETVDFTDDLCTPTVCSAERDGVYLYADATHLSVAGALTLTDRFAELIGAHARALP